MNQSDALRRIANSLREDGYQDYADELEWLALATPPASGGGERETLLQLVEDALQVARAAHRGEDEWRRLDAIALTARMMATAPFAAQPSSSKEA